MFRFLAVCLSSLIGIRRTSLKSVLQCNSTHFLHPIVKSHCESIDIPWVVSRLCLFFHWFSPLFDVPKPLILPKRSEDYTRH
jgi:hypothetical protein